MSNTSQPDFFLPADLVARALANLAERAHTAIDILSEQPDQGEPTVKEELSFRLRDYNAFIKAGFEWGRGKRPVMMPSGSWLVPSRTTGGVIYEVAKRDGYWHCGPNCKATQFHWHTALVVALEKAQEMLEQEGDGNMKHCTKCGEPKTPDCFSKDARRPDGLRGTCKACDAIARRVYHEQNRERRNAASRKWYVENAEYARQYARDYAAQNPEKVRDYKRHYHETHVEQEQEWRRLYAERNPERLQQRRKEQYWADPVAAREKVRRYRLANRAACLERDRRRHEANKDGEQNYRRRRYENNKEYFREKNRETKRRNPIANRIRANRRRVAVLQAPGDFTASQWQAMCEAFGNVCVSCGEARPLTIDHVIPISRGGSNAIQNLQPLCQPCNSSKRQQSIDYRDPAILSALVLGIERAMEMADEEDDGDARACPICDGAGCSECDGTPLTDDEIADATFGPGTARAWQEHEAEQQLWTRIARARAAAQEFNTALFAA